MDAFSRIYLPVIVCLFFIGLMVFFRLMYKWAKQQKGAAFAMGLLLQIVLPDPKVQQTIEFVAESKAEERRIKPSAATDNNDQ